MATNLTATLVSVTWLKANIPSVPDNMPDEEIVPWITTAQDMHMTGFLGGNLYQALMDGTRDNNLDANHKELRKMVKYYLAWRTVAMATWDWYVKTRVAGIDIGAPENSHAAASSDVKHKIQNYNGFAEMYLKMAKDYLEFNLRFFPEYTSNVQPPYPNATESNAGIYFGRDGHSNYLGDGNDPRWGL